MNLEANPGRASRAAGRWLALLRPSSPGSDCLSDPGVERLPACVAALVLLHSSRRPTAQADPPRREREAGVPAGQLGMSTRPGRSWKPACAPCLSHTQKLAMQYSPRNAIMYVSMVDAGTIEVLREHGQDHRQLRRPGEPLRGRADTGADRQSLRGPASTSTRLSVPAWKHMATRLRSGGALR